MSKPSDLWVRDSLVEDVVSSADGREVNTRAAEDFIVSTLERMDRKSANAALKAKAEKPDKVASEFERRAGYAMPDMRVDRAPTPSPIVPASAYKAQARKLINRRLRLINADPVLCERMKGLAVGLNSAKHEHRERAALEVERLFEETDRLFGDWRKPPVKKLVFG